MRLGSYIAFLSVMLLTWYVLWQSVVGIALYPQAVKERETLASNHLRAMDGHLPMWDAENNVLIQWKPDGDNSEWTALASKRMTLYEDYKSASTFTILRQAVWASICHPTRVYQIGNFLSPNKSITTLYDYLVRALYMTMTVTVLIPLSFVMLPSSMRRARIRWRHLLRVLVYGLPIPLVLAALGWMVFGVLIYRALVLQQGSTFRTELGLALPTILLSLWWYFAIRHYLRLKHSIWVAALLAVAVGMLTFGLFFWNTYWFSWFTI